MSVTHVEARPGAYADSVRLMQVSRTVGDCDGVEAALIAMATELNLELVAGMGFTAVPGTSPNDLLVAIRARDDEAVQRAMTTLAEALAARAAPSGGPGATGAQPPRTIGSAARETGPALTLVSVPGEHAFTEAMDALDAGCDVMIFSDNVPVEQEITLKDTAAERGLLVMGPDCGTAVVGGVGLGFAHTLDPGPVGVVAASGTGAQQVLCLLDAAGVGVSAALGVGGRDLSADVAGRSTLAAIGLLDTDPDTDVLFVVSKPPDAQVAERVRQRAATATKPVEFALIGPGQPDLTAATETVLGRLGVSVPDWPSWPGQPAAPRPGSLRGLFAGGTLCDEAMLIAEPLLGPIRSNVPLRAELAADPHAPGPGHVMLDFGDDALTVGRPHPMIDQTLRLDRLAAELADPSVAVVLLDVVLGHGAHADPAGELAPVIRSAGDVAVVVSLVGARQDPQRPAEQAAALSAAGAHVFASNAQATRFACSLVAGVSP